MLSYLTGNATRPVGEGLKVLCHCVNDAGSWGAGFVKSLRKWPHVEEAYRSWYLGQWSPRVIPLSGKANIDDGVTFSLGHVLFVQVQEQLWIANIVGQHRTIRLGETTPIRYEALRKGFVDVRAFCQQHQATAHMPRLGAGLARGSWTLIAEIIDQELVSRGVPATVYELV